MDDRISDTVALVLGLPAWLAALIYFARTVKVWPEIQSRFNERFRDRAKISSDDWKAMRDQIEWLTEEVKECRKSEGEWMQRAVLAEAKLQGRGEVRQARAAAQAELRADPDKSPEALRAAERLRQLRDDEERSK